jgi:hypothetical protein
LAGEGERGDDEPDAAQEGEEAEGRRDRVAATLAQFAPTSGRQF